MRPLTLNTHRSMCDDNALAGLLPPECSLVSWPLLFARPLHVEQLLRVVKSKGEDYETSEEKRNIASHTR